MTRHDYGRIGDVEICGDAKLLSEAVGLLPVHVRRLYTADSLTVEFMTVKQKDIACKVGGSLSQLYS